MKIAKAKEHIIYTLKNLQETQDEVTYLKEFGESELEQGELENAKRELRSLKGHYNGMISLYAVLTGKDENQLKRDFKELLEKQRRYEAKLFRENQERNYMNTER